MTDVTEREAVSSWSRCKRRSCVIFGVLCLASSMVLLLLVFLLFKPSATQPDPPLTGERCGGIAIILFLIGGFTLIVRYKIATNISSSPPPVEVVVSEIPVEDLEKSPSAFLPYKSISHHQPFDEASSADLPDYFTTMQNNGHVQTEASLGDLPDYFTTIQQLEVTRLELTLPQAEELLPHYLNTVQNTDGVYVSVKVSSETQDVPKTPLPYYEQVLEIMLNYHFVTSCQ